MYTRKILIYIIGLKVFLVDTLLSSVGSIYLAGQQPSKAKLEYMLVELQNAGENADADGKSRLDL